MWRQGYSKEHEMEGVNNSVFSSPKKHPFVYQNVRARRIYPVLSFFVRHTAIRSWDVGALFCVSGLFCLSVDVRNCEH